MIAQTRPRLRAVEIKRLHHRGRWYFHFHDQLSLAGSDLSVPIELAPALALFDGEHDLAMIRARAPITHSVPPTRPQRHSFQWPRAHSFANERFTPVTDRHCLGLCFIVQRLGRC